MDENGLLQFFESDKVQIAGLVVSSYSPDYSHWNAETSLAEFLREHNVPAIQGVDTRYDECIIVKDINGIMGIIIIRQLIKRIRQGGSPLAKLVVESEDGKADLSTDGMIDPNERNLVGEVSTPKVKVYGSGSLTVLVSTTHTTHNTASSLSNLGGGLWVEI